MQVHGKATIPSRDSGASTTLGLRLRLTTAWTMGGVVLLLLAPLTAPELIVLCLIAPLAWLPAGKRNIFHGPTATFVALYLTTGYLALNTRWSPDPVTAIETVGMIVIVVGIVDMTLIILERLEVHALEAMAVGLVGGVIIGGTYICFEAFSGQLLRRMLVPLQPWLRPEARYLAVDAHGAEIFQVQVLNLNIAALTMLFWPAMLAVRALKPAQSANRLLLLGLLPALLGVFRSEHATSKMALLGSLGIYLLYQVRPTFARALMITCWVTATMLIVPIASALFAQKLYTSPWLFKSAQERVVFWGYTSEQVAKAPLLGVGISATRVYHKTKGGANAPQAPGSEFRLETGWHSHNVYLQAWYETGAIGAVLFLAVGILVLRSFAAAPEVAQPYLWSAFGACAMMAGSSFSLWALWFLATLGMVAALAGLGTTLLTKRGQQR
jgi:O-antigen ligase